MGGGKGRAPAANKLEGLPGQPKVPGGDGPVRESLAEEGGERAPKGRPIRGRPPVSGIPGAPETLALPRGEARLPQLLQGEHERPSGVLGQGEEVPRVLPIPVTSTSPAFLCNLVTISESLFEENETKTT